MALKLPKIIGHRGAAAYAPENTLEGIHTAADMGVEWVEFDVKLTKDQVPILFHDDTLERTTNGGDTPVAGLTYEEIRQFEAGSWFADSFAGIKIPTLEEALEVVIDRKLGLNLEIKPCPGREKETAEAALDVLSRYWDDHEKLYISSYKIVSLETAMNLAPEWGRGMVFGYHSQEDWLQNLKNGRLPEDWKEVADYLGLTAISMDQDFCNQSTLSGILDHKIKPVPYNVNDAARANELLAMGAQTFISDEPDVVMSGLFSVH